MKDKIWWTRKARIQAEARLLANNNYSMLLLLWYSLMAVFYSIYFLAFPAEGNLDEVVFVCFSVLILSASLYSVGVRFSERASGFKTNYIQLQALYEKADKLEKSGELEHFEEGIREEYARLLNEVENHNSVDDSKALIQEWLSLPSNKRNDGKTLSRSPTRFHWIRLIIYQLIRVIFFSVAISLPLIAPLIIECAD